MKFSASVMEECSRELYELEAWFVTWLKEKKEAAAPRASSAAGGFLLNTLENMGALAEVRSSYEAAAWRSVSSSTSSAIRHNTGRVQNMYNPRHSATGAAGLRSGDQKTTATEPVALWASRIG